MAGFVKGSRERARARIAIDGPSGAGKSITALRLAYSLGNKVGVLDTERRSSLLYYGLSYDDKSFDFDHKELVTFSPAEYVAAIRESADAGHEVLVIDSLSHAWEGIDGALEIVGRKEGTSFTAWKDVTPLHRRMVDAILSFPGHVICTMRSKVEYVLETNDKGKSVPRKVGMAPIQRPGMEYEFTLYLSMDDDHFVKVSKTRCPAMDGATGHKPGASFIRPFVEWLATGKSEPAVGPRIEMAKDNQIASIRQLVLELDMPQKHMRAHLFRKFCLEELHLLTEQQAESILHEFRDRLAAKQSIAPAKDGTGFSRQPVQPPVMPAGGVDITLQEALEGEATKANGSGELVSPPGLATQEQLRNLVGTRESYFVMAGIGDASRDRAVRDETWKQILAKFGVTSATALDIGQCNVLTARLESKVAALRDQFQDSQQRCRNATKDAAGSPQAAPKS